MKFYITTAIDYVNAMPHLGHALEKVQADALARYHRLLGDDVFFLTGTDEHGAKIARAAEEAGRDVGGFVDANAEIFKDLLVKMNISNDYFVRTSDREAHWPAVEKVWRKLQENDDLYKKKYKGLYCVGHEAFVTRKDLVDGKCSLHGKEPEVVQEENYFFRLSKYADKIKKDIEQGRLRIIPKERANEIMRLLEQGLEDVSFSRPSKDLKWGVPVPGDPSQTIYVWADALTNYLSAIGYGPANYKLLTTNYEHWWPADVQIIGKDILRFHVAIWPGMLFALGLPLPKIILVHGFITSAGHKMSKTLGNVADPFEVVARYGADALRYYLLREIPATKDGDFTFAKFEHRYNSDLAKGVGNLVARVIGLGERYIQHELQPALSEENRRKIDKKWQDYRQHMEEFRFDEALRSTWELIALGDRIVDENKIWELPRKNPQRFKELIAELSDIIRNVGWMLRPFMPRTSDKIFEQLGLDPGGKEEQRFRLRRGEALFPRLTTNY